METGRPDRNIQEIFLSLTAEPDALLRNLRGDVESPLRAEQHVHSKSVPLVSIAAVSDPRTQEALDTIVRGLARQADVVLARIWLLRPEEVSEEGSLRRDCLDQTHCLHLVASGGTSLESAEEDFRRLPLSLALEGRIVTDSHAILVADVTSKNAGVPTGGWMENEGIRSFAGYPLEHHGQILGVLSVFARELITAEVFSWLGIFADQATLAIANAQSADRSERSEAEQREQARQLKQVLDVAPIHMFMWEADASASWGNRTSLDYFGQIPPMDPMGFLQRVTHPEDFPNLQRGIVEAMSRGESFEMDTRMRRQDGAYRWFSYRIYPVRDDADRIARWCGVRIDIHNQKDAQELSHRENISLREEIDKILMFEEIVGTSAPLQAVLSRVAKVAKTDSTVLITGETGTGKELIARAIHKRSNRATRAFVAVNCAAIPRDLIASELFGHEKGAFTGALQRRIGRFELAEGGTIFLDEIGELPAETQVALLRVLQEREFERVGGTQSIRVNTRVIAATNRDLPAAVEDGAFRSDLLYRINVFPLEVPPLRERKDDIRLLVEYFIDRYSSKMGKKLNSIDRKSLERLQTYPWPGNIRELQNVIERSVIVCDSDNFSIDESWLSREPLVRKSLTEDAVIQEKEQIEEALARAKGRVSGSSGAAALLGIPASTLDSKIKSLKIDKRRFQTS
jgi:PAS domain S-box-containing protein